jgi:hypothetical protein
MIRIVDDQPGSASVCRVMRRDGVTADRHRKEKLSHTYFTRASIGFRD